jgi:biopolymer transport protein ExbD
MATSSNETDGDHGFQIAPMVDVVFVLLLFFMACAGFKQVERHLGITVPNREPGAVPDPPIVLEIANDGAIMVNGLALAEADDASLPRLRAWFNRMPFDEVLNSPVVMRPSANTTHGRFLQVLALVKKMGFKKISFA